METKTVLNTVASGAVAASLGLSVGVGVMVVMHHNAPEPTPTETAATSSATSSSSQSPSTTGSLGHSAEPAEDAATALPTPTEDGLTWCNAEFGYVTPSDCDTLTSGGEQEDVDLPSEADTEDEAVSPSEDYQPEQGAVEQPAEEPGTVEVPTAVEEQPAEEQPAEEQPAEEQPAEEDPYLYEGEQANECQANGGVYDYAAHGCQNVNLDPEEQAY